MEDFELIQEMVHIDGLLYKTPGTSTYRDSTGLNSRLLETSWNETNGRNKSLDRRSGRTRSKLKVGWPDLDQLVRSFDQYSKTQMHDDSDLLAWRAFQLGLRIAHGQPVSHATSLDYLQQLREIADGETTLHNSAAETAKGTSLIGLVTNSTNQVVLGDRELAQGIVRGLQSAADIPE